MCLANKIGIEKCKQQRKSKYTNIIEMVNLEWKTKWSDAKATIASSYCVEKLIKMRRYHNARDAALKSAILLMFHAFAQAKLKAVAEQCLVFVSLFLATFIVDRFFSLFKTIC